MNLPLPDVSLTERAATLSPLQWVGMQGIDLPVILAEPGYQRELHARIDAQVDLPAPYVKGIHMSRLYRLLDEQTGGRELSPGHLQQLLQAMVDSHRDCESRSARLNVRFDLLARRKALISAGLAGWKAYPVHVEATLREGVMQLQLTVTVGYSSTCPCSAALARQLIEQGFERAFAGQTAIAPAVISAWLRQHATLATPHSQRSEAVVRVDVAADAPAFGMFSLIDAVEQALGTPVQTAVKRADEQAFAALNGQNLMFVEDAARRIQAALSERFSHAHIHVRHLESLHPHDAAAWAAPSL
ncbi:GTP cyclohydrolase FolE2 [Pokkaliibacter sp. MBI-7]|uniref:GTP cyclohydrolase FolE2 n=1 Tax=Pokkaliibacter sp. MBI-7 TaxID=3040600 RepID=UPI00244BDA18|nr:GTP cyclohydrolase FolE2 [Pokkaliibacter sp. MBI-7]MDH2435317.1 GTP cyclohydrolase FolE2 [Pokkaliibacter sp. MBI-7]